MKKAAEYLNQHKKILIICALLALLIALAFVLYGNKKVTVTAPVSATRTQNEEKLMRILSEIEGVGDAEVMITEEGGSVKGIIIVCRGASSLMTRSDVLNAVTCVFNVEKSNVAIYAMK